MAHRRMISQKIVDTDNFAKMSQSARYLYYELLIRADDDGFLGAPMRIVGMVGCAESDLNELITNAYVIKFETGIIVIRDWKIHNNVRGDIYQATLYQDEFNMLREIDRRYYLKSDATDNVTCDVTDSVTLGKVRLGKDKTGKINTDYQQIADMYNATCVSFPRLTKLSEKRKAAIRARLKTYALDDFKKLFEMAEGSSFLKGQNNRNWSATFDWLIADGNMAKVLDGNYNDKGSRTVNQEPAEYVEPDYLKNARYELTPEEKAMWGGVWEGDE